MECKIGTMPDHYDSRKGTISESTMNKNGNEAFNRGGKRILETNSGQISQPIDADGNTNS